MRIAAVHLKSGDRFRTDGGQYGTCVFAAHKHPTLPFFWDGDCKMDNGAMIKTHDAGILVERLTDDPE